MITITFRDRDPMAIDTAVWPVIAYGDGGSYDAEITYHIRIRRRADGDMIVSATVEEAGQNTLRSGEYVSASGHVEGAVSRVAEDLGIPFHVGNECLYIFRNRPLV